MTYIYYEFLVHDQITMINPSFAIPLMITLTDNVKVSVNAIYALCELQCSTRVTQDIEGQTDLLLLPASSH